MCKRPKLKPDVCNLKIEAFGLIIKPMGKISVMLTNNTIKIKTDFTVVDTHIRPILGLVGSRKLKYNENVRNF